MKRSNFSTTLVPVVIAAFLMTGCGDSILTETTAPAPQVSTADESFSKLRNRHLLRAKFLSRGKVLERYAELAASNDFVLGLTDPLQLYRVLERYEQMPGVTVKRSYLKVLHGFAVHVTDVESFLALVEADSDIAWIEPDLKFKNRDSAEKTQTLDDKQIVTNNIAAIGGQESWTISGNHSGSVDGVEIFILDTGVSHSDLNVVEMINFADDEPVETEMWEHGTHIAGVLASMDNDKYIVGVAPGAPLHILRVVNNSGEAEMSAAIAALDYVTLRKKEYPAVPMIVNMSLGADVGTTEFNALDEAVEKAVKKGVVVVLAAGNDAIDVSTVSPARVERAITVGAVDDIADSFASFSNFGPGIDILAPGKNTKSLRWNSASVIQMSGTSVSAPHVAGAAALYLAQYPDASPEDVLAALLGASTNQKLNARGTPANTTSNIVWVGSDLSSAAASDSSSPTDDSLKGGGKKTKGSK